MNKAEAGKKGGFIKWAKVSKKKRSAMMKKVAQARWEKVKYEKQRQTINSLAH